MLQKLENFFKKANLATIFSVEKTRTLTFLGPFFGEGRECVNPNRTALQNNELAVNEWTIQLNMYKKVVHFDLRKVSMSELNLEIPVSKLYFLCVCFFFQPSPSALLNGEH